MSLTRCLILRGSRCLLPGAQVLLLAVLLVSAGTLFAAAPDTRTVTVAKKPRQQMAYGMDFERLWSWKGLKEKQRLAEVAVRDCRVDYVRVAINGAAELQEGTFDASAYDEIMDVMRRCQAARPEIKFFASPRPIHQAVPGAPYTCFPLWISVHVPQRNEKRGITKLRHVGFEPEKAAEYMLRYLRFMKSKGFTISYLDLKNEACLKIRPGGAAAMARRIQQELGDETPLLVAPSSFDYVVGAAWVQEAREGPSTDFFDILSTHNTRGENSGSLDEFVALGARLRKPVWNTELHGWRGNDAAAVANTAVLFQQIRAGVCALNDWLSLGNEKKDYKMFRAMDDGSLEVMRIYYIFKQLVNTSTGGRYVPATVPDGLTSSAAFLRDDLMTVWLLNGTAVAVPAVQVHLGQRTIVDRAIKTVRWGPDNGREGTTGEATPAAKNALVADIGPQTLLCFEFQVK